MNPPNWWFNHNKTKHNRTVCTSYGTYFIYIYIYMYICIYIHYNDVIMSAMASQITSLTIVYSIVYSGADQRKHQSSASLAVVRGIHRWPVNSPHKGPLTRKMFPFDVDLIYRITCIPSIQCYLSDSAVCFRSSWERAVTDVRDGPPEWTFETNGTDSSRRNGMRHLRPQLSQYYLWLQIFANGPSHLWLAATFVKGQIN